MICQEKASLAEADGEKGLGLGLGPGAFWCFHTSCFENQPLGPAFSGRTSQLMEHIFGKASSYQLFSEFPRDVFFQNDSPFLGGFQLLQIIF